MKFERFSDVFRGYIKSQWHEMGYLFFFSLLYLSLTTCVHCVILYILLYTMVLSSIEAN